MSIAIMLPCERPFDLFGLKIIQSINSLQVKENITIYVGMKNSVYNQSSLKNNISLKSNIKIVYVFEPEDTCTTSVPVNLIYKRIKDEDYFITLADDFIIRGNFLKIIDFINGFDQNQPPIAVLGVCCPREQQNCAPNEISYHKGNKGHGGGKSGHPTYHATPWFAAKMSFLKSIFKDELFPQHELFRYFADELFAFRIQYKFNCIIPVYVSDTIYLPDLQPCGKTIKGITNKQERQKYLSIIKRIEETGDLCL